MKKLFTKSLFSLAILMGLSLVAFTQPKYGTGPGGVGNAKGTDGQKTNVLWLRADKGIIANSGKIDTVYDQSGNGYFAVPCLGCLPADYCGVDKFTSDNPRLDSNEINGLPAIRFGNGTWQGSGLFIKENDINAPIDGDYNLAIFLVLKPNVDTVKSTAYILNKGKECSATQDPDRAFKMDFDASANHGKINFFPNGEQKGNYTYSNTVFTNDTNNYYIFTVKITKSGQSIILYTNGKEDGDRTFIEAIHNSPAPLVFGGTNSHYSLAEAIIYRSDMSDPTISIVNNYLAAKYNIGLQAETWGKTKFYSNYLYNQDLIGIGATYSDKKTHGASGRGGLVLVSDKSTLDSSTLKAEVIMAGHAEKTEKTTMSSDSAVDRLWFVEVTKVNSTDDVVGANVYFDFAKMGLTNPNATSAAKYNLYFIETKDSANALWAKDTSWKVIDSAGTLSGTLVGYKVADMKSGYMAIGQVAPDSIPAPVPINISVINSTNKTANLYPNPANNKVNIDFASQKGGKVIISIYNIAGEKVRSIEAVKPAGDYNASIDISGLSNGIYFVNIQQNEYNETLKLIKK